MTSAAVAHLLAWTLGACASGAGRARPTTDGGHETTTDARTPTNDGGPRDARTTDAPTSARDAATPIPRDCRRAWRFEVLDRTGAVGFFPAIGVDPSGGIHIAYRAQDRTDLRYAYRAPGAGWIVETLAEAGDIGWHNDLAIDAAGVVHIAHYDNANSDLEYHRIAGSDRRAETILADPKTGAFPSIAVDAAGGVHVSHYEYTDADLAYAHAAPSATWTHGTIDALGDVGRASSIAVDSSGAVHVVYLNGDTVRAAHRTGDSWSIETVDAVANVATTWGGVPDLARDSVDGLHVVWVDTSAVRLAYAHRPPGGTWRVVRLEPQGTLRRARLAIDSGDGLHVVLQDNDGNLRYAHRPRGAQWPDGWIGSPVGRGAEVVLAVGSDATPHLAYRIFPGDDLGYAEYACVD